MNARSESSVPPSPPVPAPLPELEEKNSFLAQMQIRELLSVIRRHQLTLISCVLITIFIGAFITSRQQKKYTARTSLMMNTEPDPLRNNRRLFVSSTVIQQEIQTQIEVMKSSAVLEKVILRLKRLDSENPQADMLSEIAKLKGQISITPKIDTHIVTLKVVDANPETSARLANAIAKEFIRYTEAEYRAKTSNNITDLTTNLDSARVRLTKAQESLRRFELSQGHLSYEDETEMRMERLKRLSAEKTEKQLKVAENETLLQYMNTLPPPDTSVSLPRKLLASDATLIRNGAGRPATGSVRSIHDLFSEELAIQKKRLIPLQTAFAELKTTVRLADVKIRACQTALDILVTPGVSVIVTRLDRLQNQLAKARDPALVRNLTSQFTNDTTNYLAAVKKYGSHHHNNNSAIADDVLAFLGIKDDTFIRLPVITELQNNLDQQRRRAEETNEKLRKSEQNKTAIENRIRQLQRLLDIIKDPALRRLEADLSRTRKALLANDVNKALYRALLSDPNAGVDIPADFQNAFNPYGQRLDRLILDNYLQLDTVNSHELVRKSLNKLWEAEDQLERLQFSYNDGRPEIRNTREMIANRIANLRHAVKRVLGNLRNQYALAKENLDSLNAELKKHQEELKIFNNNRIEYLQLGQERDNAYNDVERLTRLLSQSDLQSSMRYIGATILEPATIPKRPSSPNWLKNMVLTFIAGIMIGIMASFLFEHFDDTIRDENQLRRLTGINVLCTIPKIPKEKINALATPLVESMINPTSPASESVRMLRANISMMANWKKDHAYRMLITSAMPNEGKTTIATNLAISFAMAGKKTLLIQADLRRPSSFKELDIDASLGLADVLRGEVKVRTVIRKSKQENLSLLAAGHGHKEAGELVASPRFATCLDEIESDYELIIIDSPPVTFVSDARNLCNITHGIIIVTFGGHTRINDIQNMIYQLKMSETPIIGSVINDMAARVESYYHTRYGYMKRYRYGYGYYQSTSASQQASTETKDDAKDDSA